MNSRVAQFLFLCAMAACPLHAHGANGKIMTFEGNPEEGIAVQVPESAAFTVAAWVCAEDSGRAGAPNPRIFQLPFGYLHLARNQGCTNLANVVLGIRPEAPGTPRAVCSWTFTGAVPLRQWAHLALVCRADSSVPPALYVNGARTPTIPVAKLMPSVFAAGRTTLGNTAPGGNRPFRGRMADFRFIPAALPPPDIVGMAHLAPDGFPPPPIPAPVALDQLPVIDVSRETALHTVIASGADGTYQGHPTTAIAPDGSILCVWTIGHGGPCGPMARSTDGGRTWTRCDDILPEDYRHFKNCPTLQSVCRSDGGTNLVIFASRKTRGGIVISADGGRSWQTAPVADISSGMPPTGFMMLKDGRAALFGQMFKSRTKAKDRPTDDQVVWMSISADGGRTWGPMRIVAAAPQKNLCEPCCIRSPDGGELCLLMRENRHTSRSMMCFSKDEGATWTSPEDTCWGLSGDRHESVYLPDGRLFIAFRDRALGSSTYGQYVAWVGTYADLRAGRSGDCRVLILRHLGENVWDTGYSGVELLPDATILCTTYLHYRASDKAHSVVCTRVPVSAITSDSRTNRKREAR